MIKPIRMECDILKAKFYKIESKINDFISFPKLVFIEDNVEFYTSPYFDTLKNKDFFKEYDNLLNEISIELKPYKKRLEQFISTSNLYKYNIIDFLISDLLFKDDLKIKSIDDLFKIILNMNEKELIYSAISKFLLSIIYDDSQSFEEFSSFSFDEDTIYDINKLLKIVNESNLETDVKWTFMLFYNNPVDYIKKYIDIMNEIYPIFIKYYNKFEKNIINIGEDIEKLIKEEGATAVNRLTLSVLDDNILNNTDFLRIIISFTFPNAIAFSESIDFKNINKKSKTNTIIWGTNYKKISDAIMQIKEDDIGNRVDIFKSLGDKTRYEVLRLISQGVHSNKKLAELTNVSTATISYHVNSFVENGILIIKRIDNKLTHVIDYEVMENLIVGFKDDFKLK